MFLLSLEKFYKPLYYLKYGVYGTMLDNKLETQDFGVNQGSLVSFTRIPEALRLYNSKGVEVASMPLAVDKRLSSDGGSPSWNFGYTTLSLKVTGTSKRNNKVVVYVHGIPHYFSESENIRKAVSLGLVNGAGILPRKEFFRILSLEDNINVHVLDYRTWERSDSGVISIKKAYKNPAIERFIGNRYKTEQYLKSRQNVHGKTIGVLRSDDLSYEPLARLLFLGVGYDIIENGSLNSFARFIPLNNNSQTK